MSKKKKKQHQRVLPAAPSPAIMQAPAISQNNRLEYLLPVLLCVLLAVLYGIVYDKTEGLYQHDEAAHLLDMLNFWDHPLDTITGLWSRGGYKILYCLSALGGYPAIIFTNILFTAGTAWLTWRVARGYQLPQSWLAIVLFGVQPFVINLSFRCYAEIPTMFFTVLVLRLWQMKRYMAVAIVVSFLFTLRQEMMVFAILAGIFFAWRRKWIPLLLLAWAPLVLGLLGWLNSGDPLFLVHSILQGGVTDTYQRNGFFYLWLMFPEVMGSVVVMLFTTGILSFLVGNRPDRLQRLRRFHAVLILFGVYFLMHCAFTSKSFGFGKSGGLGRFLVVVAPCVAIIAHTGFAWLADAARAKRHRVIIACISAIILLMFIASVKEIMPYVFNAFTVMILEKEQVFLVVLATAVLLLIILLSGRMNSVGAGVLAVIIFFGALVSIRPLERGAEDETMKLVSDWYWHSSYAGRPVHTAHILFTYYGLDESGSRKPFPGFDSLSLVNAKPGDLFLYENHYAWRNVSPQLVDKSRLLVIKEFNITGSPFAAVLLEKR